MVVWGAIHGERLRAKGKGVRAKSGGLRV